jgi:hypothetical protein
VPTGGRQRSGSRPLLPLHVLRSGQRYGCSRAQAETLTWMGIFHCSCQVILGAGPHGRQCRHSRRGLGAAPTSIPKPSDKQLARGQVRKRNSDPRLTPQLDSSAGAG